MNTHSLPVAVIGAGPVGLAAAAHLLERGEVPLVLEAGASAGASIRQWAHVRMFSPWRYAVDHASRRLLERTGWNEPDPDGLPTGGELVEQYLEPLARRTALRAHLRFNQRVTAVTRLAMDKVWTSERDSRPFVVRTIDPDGREHRHLARAVIDASGTWRQPNPMGADGLQPPGEERVRDRIDHGIPDVAGARRAEFAGTTVLVVGSGHSAFHVVLDLLAIKREVPDTRIIWAMRRASPDDMFGGGAADALPARGALGQRARDAMAGGALAVVSPFLIQRLARVAGDRVQVTGDRDGREHAVEVDRIIVATGFRPELGMLREVRVELDPWLEAPRALGPLIDPNLHSCGTVRPHGARELAHPEKDLYIVGMKSYGRAPTFLLATGYEQVRSVVAELAGDHAAAGRVELNLPGTGVCSLAGAGAEAGGGGCCSVTPGNSIPRITSPDTEGAGESPAPAVAVVGAASGCCGGPPRENAAACCLLDEQKKSEGNAGCGCASAPPPAADPEPPVAAACCG
jgi:thioredoxin reductase